MVLRVLAVIGRLKVTRELSWTRWYKGGTMRSAGMYSAKSIANYFIQLGIAAGSPVDHQKLQKLVYFAHGVYLGIFGKPLISERVEAWKFGPVVPAIQKAFRRYGIRPITELALEIDDDALTIAQIPSDKSVLRVLDTVWEAYGRYSGSELSWMAQKEGTPWAEIFKQQGEWSWIPDQSISDWFKSRLAKASA